MAYTGLMLFSCMFLQVFSSLATEPMGIRCSGPSGVESTTNNRRYLANLDLLVSSLSSHAISTGFYNATVGACSDKVYGLYLCRGDITPQSCQNCTQFAGKEFEARCPSKAAAIVWYDRCMIRYSNQSIFSKEQQEPVFYPYGPVSITNLDQYNQTVASLLHRLVTQALSGSSTPKYYATGEQDYYTGVDKVYGLVQCTPDITKDECRGCLIGGIDIDIDISKKLYPKQGQYQRNSIPNKVGEFLNQVVI